MLIQSDAHKVQGVVVQNQINREHNLDECHDALPLVCSLAEDQEEKFTFIPTSLFALSLIYIFIWANVKSDGYAF